MVLTATRSNEARGATWSEIDLDARTWTIPAGRMKAKRTHRVPLCERAMAILDEARTLGPATGDALVFPGASKGRPLAGATLLNLLERAGFDTTLHGFRSAFADWARERTNVPTAVAEAALAHTVKNAAVAPYAPTAASPGACPPRSPSCSSRSRPSNPHRRSTPSSAPHASAASTTRSPPRPCTACSRARACSTNAPATPSPPTDDDSPSVMPASYG